MYFYESGDEGFVVRDENGSPVARAAVEADAREIVAALNLVGALAEQFPGLKGGSAGEGGARAGRGVEGAELAGFIAGRVVWDEDGRFREAGETVAHPW